MQVYRGPISIDTNSASPRIASIGQTISTKVRNKSTAALRRDMHCLFWVGSTSSQLRRAVVQVVWRTAMQPATGLRRTAGQPEAAVTGLPKLSGGNQPVLAVREFCHLAALGR